MIRFLTKTNLRHKLVYYRLRTSSVEKDPAETTARGVPCVRWPPNVLNTKIYCGFYRTGFQSPDKRQYSEHFLWYPRMTSTGYLSYCFVNYYFIQC